MNKCEKIVFLKRNQLFFNERLYPLIHINIHIPYFYLTYKQRYPHNVDIFIHIMSITYI